MRAAIEFGALLRHLRREARLTQQQLADETGFCQTEISHWERGVNIPSRPGISQLLRSFPDAEDDLRAAWREAMLELLDIRREAVMEETE